MLTDQQQVSLTSMPLNPLLLICTVGLMLLILPRFFRRKC